MTATWCARPIELGQPGWTLLPLVLGPDRVPLVTDAELARRHPELAVLSAMAHGRHPDREKILDALLGAFAAVDQERATLYSDVVLAALPEAAQRYLEALMTTRTYEYQSEFVRRFVFQGRAEGREEGRDEGRAQGEAMAVLAVLDARGIAVPDDIRARITACADAIQLDTWIRRAATADTIDALFG
jgi:hypothetical protein